MKNEITQTPLSKVTIIPYNKKEFESRNKPKPLINNYSINIKRNNYRDSNNRYDNRRYTTNNQSIIQPTKEDNSLIGGMFQGLGAFVSIIIRGVGLIFTLGLFERNKGSSIFDIFSKRKRRIKEAKKWGKKFNEM